jgi:hypothetical protein
MDQVVEDRLPMSIKNTELSRPLLLPLSFFVLVQITVFSSLKTICMVRHQTSLTITKTTQYEEHSGDIIFVACTCISLCLPDAKGPLVAFSKANNRNNHIHQDQ